MRNLPWLVAILALAALSGCPAGIQWEPEMPASLDGGWMLEKVDRAPPEEAPVLLRQLHVADGMESVYKGPGKLTVTVYRMRTASTAFEAVQKWRPEPGSVVFHTGGVFTIVSSPSLDNAGLNRIARQLEEKWSRGR
jgi:hypothetical protein